MKTYNVKTEVDGYYCPGIKSRWKNYSNYRLILWAWMMNEFTTMFTPTEVSHNGFYIHAAMHATSVILIGMPLAYSEICLGQYANCDLFTMWNFCPLFRNVGFASYYLIFTKGIYILVLTAWHLKYTLYAAMDTPPWSNCNDFGDIKCMVKRINVSVFQHCLEIQILFGNDCGVKTASNCFFEREIGSKCTAVNPTCYRSWKTSIAGLIICLSVYILSIKKEKIIQIVVRALAYYVCIVILILFFIALSTTGTWYATKVALNWSTYDFYSCFNIVSRGFLSIGTGSGILIYLSRDESFRSPATMTALSTCLCTILVTFMLSLIAYSGIKTMSYYHGEEENIIEISYNPFFPPFASISEIMSYFDSLSIWAFAWFSIGFLSLYVNFWILYLFMLDTLINSCELLKWYKNILGIFLMIFIIICTLPFLCTDVTKILTDATEIMQTFNSLLLSVSLYWIYGVSKHNVDIIFMIGIKASYFWKLTWLLNPILLMIILYRSWEIYEIHVSRDSYYIKSLNIYCDILIFYIILGIYVFIIIIGMFLQILKYCIAGKLHTIILPTKDWGPKDKILLRSRIMFLPEIMTREFLYRQVRVRGYKKRQIFENNLKVEKAGNEFSIDEITWNALTSN